ncbi:MULTISPECIES: sugar kinase [Lelliottia]|uniref:2-dehydro-3-deoxygluconokinase n=1 Tax=Lelliottia aquatilis TaxID=2080838 RepID=A0ABX4ZWG3_9ENTR|nr:MULTISPECIES: sugar kinase [Lelliottia]NTZ46273.1 sugar kinase [Lelliottia aquatilis]POZ15239.1 2-dehydro-3-deoxygluconokinase [Lelliottia sp. 7254-16]POZ18978.1 2-dehydro-3-deoxygluconokinase [Lelliottia aquatilis]POZ20819.1 2-dehydro-3-deoxygluconokinase [Lelliottia aquatilis]POZ30609.1 2-dehydro-3-deoxygluconokinase [Lelliottia aquatilis]
MPSSLDVITIGEAMAMFVATETGELRSVEHFIKRVAGAELNVATGLARLGLNVGWVSRVGDDSFGQFILDSLKKEGINAEGVTLDSRFTTGFQLKSKVDNGTDPIVEYFRKGSAASHLSTQDYHPAYFASARHLHLSGVAAALSESSYALLDHAASAMKALGKTISFDPNLRPVLWKSEAEMVEKLNHLAFQADWVLPGLKEGMILTGQNTPEGIADFYLNQGVNAVVLKTGADGAWFKTAAGEKGAIAAVKVENVVDTVGAGDGFAVGVISALLEGKTLQQALVRGNKIGSLAIQVQGDSEGLPTRAQLSE